MKAKTSITNRLPLYIGRRCNQSCKFCYYYTQVKEDNYSFEEITYELIKYKKNGIESIDITGGEPTIHKDIIKILKKAVELGFTNISMISNGIALKNEMFTTQLIESGVDSFVLSIHGYNSEIHDSLTGRKGAFQDVLKSIEIIKKRNHTYSINHVINKSNYKTLPKFANLVRKIKGKNTAVTFLVMNPINDASINYNDYVVKYTEISPYLIKAIDVLEKHDINSSWKFMPLCINQDKVNCTDSIFTFFINPYDWNYNVQLRLNYKKLEYFLALFDNFKKFNYLQLTKIPLEILVHIAMLNEYFSSVFTKIQSCKKCKFYYVCDGINHSYLQVYGDEEFLPIKGVQIINPLDLIDKEKSHSFSGILINYLFFYISKVLYKALLFFSKINTVICRRK